jgi:threonyl-tRNA synthetase
LELALNAKGIDWELQPGEGAFYGPKVDFSLRDSIGRVWQCGTIQVDFSMPSRLGAYYIAEDGSRQVPVMLHRALLGSLERFIGILIEEYAGKFPPWLAPVQAVVMSITDQHREYASGVTKSLQNQGFRARSDLRNEKIGLKIREHTLQRVPYMLICGEREMRNAAVAVRTRGGKDLGAMTLEDFAARLRADIVRRGRHQEEE